MTAAHTWLIVRDGLVSGLSGTMLMTVTAWAEQRIRGSGDRVIDYDASEHVVIATSRVLGVRPTTAAQRRALFLLTHWGYGSAVAVAHEVLRLRLPEKGGAPVFYAGCQAMAFALFPAIGDTPPPWRWRRDVMVTSVMQHVVYTSAVVAVSSRLHRRRQRA